MRSGRRYSLKPHLSYWATKHAVLSKHLNLFGDLRVSCFGTLRHLTAGRKFRFHYDYVPSDFV